MARSMFSTGTEASRARSTAAARVMLPSTLPPPSRAAASICRSTLAKTFPRFWSVASFLLVIWLHLEWPDIRSRPRQKVLVEPGLPHQLRMERRHHQVTLPGHDGPALVLGEHPHLRPHVLDLGSPDEHAADQPVGAGELPDGRGLPTRDDQRVDLRELLCGADLDRRRPQIGHDAAVLTEVALQGEDTDLHAPMIAKALPALGSPEVSAGRPTAPAVEIDTTGPPGLAALQAAIVSETIRNWALAPVEHPAGQHERGHLLAAAVHHRRDPPRPAPGAGAADSLHGADSYQPRTWSRPSSPSSLMSWPRMGSPRPRDTLARASGSLK